MRLLKEIGWILPSSLFLMHQLTQKVLHISLPFADSYLDPFCLSALGLYAVQLERKWLFDYPKLAKADVLLIVTFLTLISEVVFPYFSNKFFSDWRDVLGICLGAFWFTLSPKPEQMVTP